jgi:hypothetical protein
MTYMQQTSASGLRLCYYLTNMAEQATDKKPSNVVLSVVKNKRPTRKILVLALLVVLIVAAGFLINNNINTNNSDKNKSTQAQAKKPEHHTETTLYKISGPNNTKPPIPINTSQ